MNRETWSTCQDGQAMWRALSRFLRGMEDKVVRPVVVAIGTCCLTKAQQRACGAVTLSTLAHAPLRSDWGTSHAWAFQVRAVLDPVIELGKRFVQYEGEHMAVADIVVARAACLGLLSEAPATSVSLDALWLGFRLASAMLPTPIRVSGCDLVCPNLDADRWCEDNTALADAIRRVADEHDLWPWTAETEGEAI